MPIAPESLNCARSGDVVVVHLAVASPEDEHHEFINGLRALLAARGVHLVVIAGADVRSVDVAHASGEESDA